MRKLFVLSLFWFPITFLLLAFSLFALVQKSDARVNANLGADRSRIPTKPASISPGKDIRVLALQRFLQEYKSPLVEVVEELVQEADLWGLDYALLPAIALQESGGCKSVPAESFNCWGFGIYGGKITRFNSYNEAMAQVAKTIKEAYIKNGLANPTLLEDKWAPPSKGQWSYAVNYFIGKIREYERNTPAS